MHKLPLPAGQSARPTLLLLSGLLVGCGTTSPATKTEAPRAAQTALEPARRPNILLIVADDLGYSDIGAFGGEIATPNLDALAREGRLLTDHHTAATCSPTRSMLISGTDHHLVGLGSMAELLRPEQVGKPGYEGYLNEHSLSIAQLLFDAGYHTYVAGKWHLGTSEDKSPKAWGFESSYVLVEGGSSHFAPVPGKLTGADRGTYREDGKEVSQPADFYSSNFYTDKLLEYLQRSEQDQRPFFAFAAYTAPHWPLQAPADDLERYRGKYDAGYDAIREARLARQRALGVIPADFVASKPLPSTPDNPGWDKLSPAQRKLEARRMEVYAAMVDNLDRNIGRLIDNLKQSGRYDDTLVFFQSDNGAEGGPTRYADNEHTDNSLENFGRPLSNIAYGPRWGEVSATPFHLWKGFSSEGGVLVPALVRLPRQTESRPPFAGLSHVTDLAPTFLELASVANPGAHYKGRDVHPITGSSLLPALSERAERVHPAGSVLADELFGRRYVRRDQWKLSWIEPPFGTGRWALYDLSRDRAEAHDVSRENPAVFSELSQQWDAYAQRVGVILPEVPGFAHTKR